jgi:hypothetical protein
MDLSPYLIRKFMSIGIFEERHKSKHSEITSEQDGYV